MDELDMLFASLDENELEELLADIDEPAEDALVYNLKSRLGIPAQKQKKQLKSFPIKRMLPLAAVFTVVIACAVTFFVNSPDLPDSTTTTEALTMTTSPAPMENPLMTAISAGNDELIEKLLNLDGFISQEALGFALNFSSGISYDTLYEIAASVRESLGSTGLDSLLESAIFGDSQKALEELKKRENMLMTPFEKLAFFFSVAFCNSEVVDEFVNKGYDVNTKDSQGNSIYAIAKKYGNDENMHYAVSKGITA